MENSMKPSYEQGERGSSAALVSISVGFSLFWMLFFTALLYDPFAKATLPSETLALPLPIAMCAGFAATGVLVFAKCDFFSGERGHKFLWAIVSCYAVIPAIVLFTQAIRGAIVPAPLAFAAWLVIGIGLGSLLMLWSELLVSFVKGFASKAIAFSTCIGALLYFAMSSLPTLLGICFLCIASPLSLALLRTLEKETPAAPFVPRAECLRRHRLTKPIDALNTLYGAVFGLAIFMLSRSDPSLMLYGGIAVSIAAGALFMVPFFSKNTDKMMHGTVQKILFPILVIGLMPLPFVDGVLQVLCMLVILMGYVCLTLVNLDSLYCLVKKYKVTAFYLTGRGHSPILVGVSLGYLVGYVAAFTNAVGNMHLVFTSLAFVVLMSVFVTTIDFDPDHLKDEHEDLENAHPHDDKGSWKRKCTVIAETHDLSAREIEVFLLLAKGRGTTYIQDKLYISSHTVKSHTYKIYRKLGVGSREELITLVENATVPNDERAGEPG